MGTALFTGVTGLQAHQRRLDVVASNIANINTIGYRGSRVLFQDLFSQTLQGGSAPVGNFGGTNPQQIGLGVKIASIDVDHTQGSLITTGVSSDLAIQGNGFFVLSDGVRSAFSRDGSFELNANGLLVEPGTGMRVQGYLADEQGVIDTNALVGDIAIPVGATGIVRPTSLVSLIGNLNSDETELTTVERTLEVFDSLGTPRIVTMTFTKSDSAVNEWSWAGSFDGQPVGFGAFTFESDGTLDPANTTTTGTIEVTQAMLTADGTQPETLTFTVDFSALTHLSTGTEVGSDVTVRNQDGFARGVLQSFNIGANGQINGVFSNGLTRVIAQVALANFSNVGGLSRDGNNTFLATPASGTAQIGAPESGGRGAVSGGVLENSNVDLGSEFSNLIITQRGFQANARTITAADTLLQETVNLVR